MCFQKFKPLTLTMFSPEKSTRNFGWNACAMVIMMGSFPFKWGIWVNDSGFMEFESPLPFGLNF